MIQKPFQRGVTGKSAGYEFWEGEKAAAGG
jgi:hypothetical protein